jgi:hypothetical protein
LRDGLALSLGLEALMLKAAMIALQAAALTASLAILALGVIVY